MEPSSPIDSNIGIASEQYPSTIDGGSTRQLTKFIQALECRTIPRLTHIKLCFFLSIEYKIRSLLLGFQHHIISIHVTFTCEDIFTDVVLQISYILRMVES